MSLYVYCLGEELACESLEDLSGVGGARVGLFTFGRLAAVVSDFDGEGVAVNAENVRAHNRVNARVLARSTPLPFRFGTLVGESRLKDYMTTNETALDAALERVRGCVEMCVKIKWDEAEKAEGRRRKAEDGSVETSGEDVLTEAETALTETMLTEAVLTKTASADASLTEAAHGAEVGAGQVGSGTAFLLAKRREIFGDEDLRRRAEEVAAWLDARVSSLARESAVRVSPSEAIVVRASHLVEHARVEEYKACVRACEVERRGLHFLTSGPWPPYSFSELRG
jgi:hypothetical protein